MRLTSFSLKWKLNLWLYNSCCIHSGQGLVCSFVLGEKASLFLGLLRIRNHDWNSAGVAYFRTQQRILHTAFRDIDSLFSLFASQSEIGWTFGMQKQGKSSGKEQKICLYLEWSMKVLYDFIVCFGAGWCCMSGSPELQTYPCFEGQISPLSLGQIISPHCASDFCHK